MAAVIGTGIDEEELRRQQEEAERIAREQQEEAERIAAEQAENAQAQAAEAAAANEAAAREAQEKAAQAAQDAQEKGFNRTVQEKIHGIHINLVEAGDIQSDALPPDKIAELNEKNRKGELGYGSSWGAVNRITVDYNTIKDPEQAVFFATMLDTDKDKMTFFEEYAKSSGMKLEDVLAYADDRLGTKIFATPQSNAGKRDAMTSALQGIGLFDINGDDIDIGTADFDTVVQSLGNIADADKAKKAASYVESLTKIPGSPYYGMTFDKASVEYRNSANLPADVFEAEKNKLAGVFYSGEGHAASNQETYLAQYEQLQEIYGADKYAFRQVERALKDAYEKQTGYAAPDSDKVQEVIQQTKAERALAAQMEAEESNKSFFEKVSDAWHGLFPEDKKEEEKDVAPIETQDVPTEKPYSIRSGYIASAGPMSSGLLAENNWIRDTVAEATEKTQVEESGLEHSEELPEAQGPVYQPRIGESAGVVQNQQPMSYMEAVSAYSRGEELSEENMAQLLPGLENDDFRNYVLNNVTPDPQQMMQERAYGGTVLTDAQARKRAATITSGRQLLGTVLGGAVESLETGALPQDITGAGYQLMADVMNSVSREIRSGRIAVPAGENKYDYVISHVPQIREKADQLANLQRDVNNIMATRAIEAAHDYDKKVEDAELRFMRGHATQEDVMLLSSRANADGIDINDDKTRMQFRAQLSGRSMWYDDDGAFWKSGSAAAEEGLRLRETRADGQYGEYKIALWNKAHDIIDELTYIAADHGMTLGGWMEKVGMSTGDPTEIMQMAHNRICAEGMRIGNDPQAQKAIDTIAGVETQGVGMLNAGVKGLGHGLADDTYHFMNAGYMMLDAATYESRRNEIAQKYDSQYGKFAPKVYRSVLIAYANNGELSKEMSQELLEDIERCDNIFDIPIDVDPGLIEGLYLGTMNELSKTVEQLESVRELLPENERKVWDAMYGVGTNVPGMVRSSITTIGAAAAGVPLPAAKTAGLWMGYGATAFSRGTDKYEKAGMSRGAAMFMGSMEAAGMMAVNLVGQDTATSYLTGKSLMRDGIEDAFRGGKWYDVAKAIASKAAPLVAEEAVEEAKETFVEAGVALSAPVVEAISNGEQITLSKGMQMAWEEFKDVDVKSLMSEAVAAGMGGAAYGALFTLPSLAVSTYRGRANARVQEMYPSVDIASRIVHGEIDASDENMGRFIEAMQKDLAKPDFRALLDKKNDSAEQANNMAVAAILGEGKEFRDKALKLTQTADQYDKKADAAEKAVQINRSQFYTARKLAMEGNEGAIHSMEGFRTAWAKAQTTATESRQAAQKKREEAAEQTARWILSCRKLGNDMHALTKTRAGNLLVNMSEEKKAEEMELDISKAETNVVAMGAEAFIEERYPNASDEQKDHIREVYGAPVESKQTSSAPIPDAEVATGMASEAPTEPIAETARELTEEPAAAASQAPVRTIQTQTGAQRLEANEKRRLKSAMDFAGQVRRRYGVAIEIVDPTHEKIALKSGRAAAASYDRDTDTIYVSKDATQGDIVRAKIVHELTHRTENTQAYEDLSKALMGAYFKGNKDNEKSERNRIKNLYSANGVSLTDEGIQHEIVAIAAEKLIGGDEDMVNRLVADSPSVARRIMDAIKSVLDKLTGVRGTEVDQLRNVERMFQKALNEAEKQRKANTATQYSVPDTFSADTGEALTGTVGGDTVVQYSLSSWTPEEQSTVRSSLISKGYDEDAVDNWIDDVNSVAAIVAADRDRLDFEAADNQVMLKPNAEYVRTLDASTLCAKRLLYQGTFNAIQHRMPSKVMTSDDLIRLRNMMAEVGYETPCGICYVESRRRNLGTFAQKWLKDYDPNGGYQPKLDDVTTTDGLERMRTQHPEVYDSFVGEMKRKGSNNPKVVQLRTDYRGDIRKLSKSDIEKIIKIGGLRVQSFSDFETPHLLDMMQAVLDMTESNLTSQAYTKVPNFAWAFGDTGIKINLSLIAEGDGFDADGNLAFSSYEGMDFDEAMRLRDRYSQNVGTILVGLSDKHIRAAMADPRIDFIIPFHKSGWGKRQLSQLSGMSGYMDYTRDQNERRVIGQTKTGKPKTKNVPENFHPVDYWDYSLTGNQNAETYLRMCEEDGRIPKFSRFLPKDADGHWVAPDGYWKLLIDFKMYNNDGVGAPQMPVRPNFNMEEARRILGEYEGGANELPVAHDIVERFVSEKSSSGNVQYSVDSDTHYDYSKTFAEQIEDWRHGRVPKGAPLLVGGTPKVLQKIGLSNIPLTINDEHIGHAIRGTKADHRMSWEMLAHLPELLEDPIAIIESSTRPNDSVVVLVDATINGKQVVSPITIQTTTEMNSVQIDANHLASAYGKYDNAVALFEAAVKKENAKHKGVGVYYVDKNRASNLISDPRLQLPNVSDPAGLIHSIFDAGSPVKRNYLEQTDTRQFKKWFSGSKAVNADGSPMVLYHGSKNTGIDVFRTKNQWGYGGLHLSRYEDVAQDYAGSDGKVYKLYASVKRPYIVQANNKWYDSIDPTEELKEWRRANGYSANNINRAADTFEFAAYARDAKNADGSPLYDGVIIKNVHEQTGQYTDDYIIFEPEQVKSTDENVGLFDPKNPNIHYSIDEPTLPDDDFLRAEIDEWKRGGASYSVDAQTDTGKRQFANNTIQENAYVPDHIKQTFLNDPSKANYSKESNAKQLADAWSRVQNEGFNGVKDRLLAQDTTFTTEDNADALVLMSQSLHDDDLDTFMSIASKYNTEGTDQAKALQIRSLMKTMTPTGFAQKVIKDASRKMDEHLKNHHRQSKKISRKVKDIDEKLGLRKLDGRSGIQKLVEAGESIKIDNKYGVPLNDRQRVLIKEFGLEKVRHPGMFYNWASTKQRMLMDILTTDDVYAEDYNGFNLVERLIRMEAGQPVVTKADISYITENMNLFNSYADRNSRDADIALSRAYEAYGNINPASGKMKRRTWRYTSMLLSVPSAIRNVIGNAAQSVPNAIADGVAVELDRLFSAITGEDRTRAHINISDRIDGWEAFRDETFNTFRDYFIDKTITQNGESRYNENRRGRVFENQFGETLRRMEGLLMSVGDRNFWKKKFFNSLAEQQHLAEINGAEFNLEQAMETAEAEANYATFNEDNAVRSLFTKMKDIPAIGTVVDHIMPFTGVPTNIIKRQIEFSPIGIAATAWKHGLNAIKGGDFDQRAFVDGMARGLTGSALMGIGALLLKGGILKLGTKEEDDDKSYGVRTAQGDQYGVYFTIGDKNYSISTFSPAASALVAGAFVADALKNNEAWYQAVVNGTLKNVNEIFDASYMSSLADLLNTSNGGNIVDNAIPTVLNSMLTQNIPAPITHLASSMDPYVRDTKDKDAIMEVVKTTMSKIPGARELLPEKVDVAGRAVENTKHGVAAFVDPFTTSYAVDDPALSEMIRLRDVLTEKGASEPRAHMASDALSGRRNTLTQNKVTYTVTPEEKEAYRKRYGDLWRNGGMTYDKKGKRTPVRGVEELIASRAYQLMTDEEKAEAIKDILQMAKVGATYEIMNHK